MAGTLEQLATSQGSILMVPMDHGVSMGPLPGLERPAKTLEGIVDHATCVTAHKGVVRRLQPFADRIGIMMHLSASTDLGPDPDDKRLVGTVAEAAALGCHGVSTHINLGARTEARMVEDLGRVSTACNAQDMPLVVMAYPRGPTIEDPSDAGLVAHAARLAMELGADAVKVPYTGDPGSFTRVVEGADIPVIVAGGPKRDDLDAFLADLQDAKAAGAAGVSIGRNVFQADDPGAAMRAIAAIFP